jgi:gliding motility-associated-like protein
VNVQPVVSTINDISICRGDSLQLITTTDANNNQWIPALSVNNSSIANPYFQDTVSQQMIITGTNVTGCLAKDTVNVTVKPLPVVLSIPDSSLCGAQNITLTTTGALTYSWLPSIGLSNAGIASPVFNGNNTQTYTVTGTGANSCKAKDSVTITINSVPIVTTISNTSICRGDSILLTSNSNAQVNQWSPATSVSNPGTANPYFIDTISQTITLTGTNTSTGCFASTNVNITVKPTPNVVSISDFTSCATNTVTLTTTGAQSYSWSPTANLDDPTISSPVFLGPTGTYTYFVTGTAANGCTAKDIVNITIANKPVFNAPENKTICENEAVQLDGNNGITYGYLWSPATNLNNPGIVNPIANPSLTTPYTLVISDSTCNYDSTFRVLVTVNSLPIINATKSNDLNCSTPESKLTASGAINYNWFPSEGLSNNTINNPIASPSYTTQYVVIGTDNNGCKNSDTITVYRKGGKYFGFNIPNSFTPNGDGLNDCFGVTYWGETKNFQLIVYSRWGEKIFETHNISECWDGIYKGNPAETGSYVFLIKGETLCGKVNRKGNILLIR